MDRFITTKTLATLMFLSCLAQIMAGAAQRGSSGEAPEAWWIEKPIGGQSAYTSPMRPLWRLADLKKAHVGQNNWSQPIVLDDEQDATYNSGAPGTKITTRMHPQTDTVFVVMAGQMRFTAEGQEPVVTKRGSIINILKSTLYSYEVVGNENALWVEDNVRGYGTGNLNVKVTVQVPDKLSKRQIELLKEFEAESKKKKGMFGF